MHTRPLLSPATWARDFGLLGLSVGSLAPFFVLFDPGFAVLSGLVGGGTGALVGTALAWSAERLRGLVPLAVLVPAAAAVGSLWGALAGASGGVGSLWIGVEAVPLGFVVGGCTGMVALGGGFLPYLVLSTRGSSTLPLLGFGVLVSPFLGWVGLVALAASVFGMWLFALPFLMWAGVAFDRSERRALQHRPVPELSG